MQQRLLHFIFMAEGANQSISEMSLLLHRAVTVQEAHAAPLRPEEHSEVPSTYSHQQAEGTETPGFWVAVMLMFSVNFMFSV